MKFTHKAGPTLTFTVAKTPEVKALMKLIAREQRARTDRLIKALWSGGKAK